MTESTYTEQYKDPRWQKLRLRVLDRDNWKCQKCYDTDSTLHVHHLYCENGKSVWDYPLTCFVTLCEKCHDEETRWKKECVKNLIEAFTSVFLPSEISLLASAIYDSQDELCQDFQQYSREDVLIAMGRSLSESVFRQLAIILNQHGENTGIDESGSVLMLHKNIIREKQKYGTKE